MATKKFTKKNKTAAGKGFFGSFIDDMKENINEGTKILTEKSTEVIEKVKEKSNEAYKAGAGAVETVNEKVHDFTEKQRLQKEWKEKDERRDELVYEFGGMVLGEYLKNDSVHKRFLTKKDVSQVVDEIKDLNKDMKAIEKKLT